MAKQIKLSSLSEGLRVEVKKHMKEGRVKLSTLPKKLRRVIEEEHKTNYREFLMEKIASHLAKLGYQHCEFTTRRIPLSDPSIRMNEKELMVHSGYKQGDSVWIESVGSEDGLRRTYTFNAALSVNDQRTHKLTSVNLDRLHTNDLKAIESLCFTYIRMAARGDAFF